VDDDSRQDKLGKVLRVIGLALLVPAVALVLLALLSFLAGDGVADAAPWWAFFLVLAALPGVLGLLALLLARLTRSNRARMIVALGIPALALTTLACASAGSTTTAQLTEVEARWVKALREHDTVALDRLLDDSFVDSTFRGTLRGKRDVLAGPPAGGPYHSIRLDDLAVRSYGRSTAIVTGVNVLQGKDAADIVRVRFTDVFVRQHGEWRAVAAQETVETTH